MDHTVRTLGRHLAPIFSAASITPSGTPDGSCPAFPPAQPRQYHSQHQNERPPTDVPCDPSCHDWSAEILNLFGPQGERLKVRARPTKR
jgi:hypothetical protein